MLSWRRAALRQRTRSPDKGSDRVFALQALPAGVRIFERLVTTWREAARWYKSVRPTAIGSCLDCPGGDVIDGGRGGNGARSLNPAYVANCEAVEQARRVYIDTLRDIAAGEALFIDSALDVPRASLAHACRGGAKRCRGTMLGTV